MRPLLQKNRLFYTYLAALSALGALGFQATAQADDSLRCDNKLVSSGAAPYEVRATCGNPDDIQARTETRTIRRAIDVPCARGYCSTFIEDAISVNVEEWTYDFGTQRFIQYLTFEQGRLIHVRSGKYGKKQL